MAGKSKSIRHLLAGFASVLAMSAAAPAFAQASGAQQFTIEAQSLGSALNALSRQSGVVIIAPSNLVEGRSAPRLDGSMTTIVAVRQLLQGTGLEAVRDQAGAIIIREQVTRTPARQERQRSEAPPEEEIVVTGTRIRGGAPQGSPVQIFTREEILNSGASTTEDFLRRSVPQNFAGGSSEFVPVQLPNDTSTGQNNIFGSSANLRGLGSRGTLVLLNGNRVAPSSEIGDFIDLSMIPISALDRIDVLTDGASSIYGGDAVAGVINFVLRGDFRGSETTLRYGSVTDGNLSDIRFSQALGSAWASGNVLAIYEFYERDRLRLSDRETIQIFAPQGSGSSLPDRWHYSLLPAQERHSAVLSASQEITSRVRLDATALYSDRTTSTTSFNFGGTLHGFQASTENLTLSAGVEVGLSDTWLATINTTYSQIESRSHNRDISRIDGRPLVQERVRTESDIWSIDARVDGDLFAVPGGVIKVVVGGHFRQETFENEILGARVTAAGDRDVSAAYAELLVPIVSSRNALPGIHQLSLSLSGRAEDYSDFGTSSNPKVGVVWAPVESLRLRTSYSTSFAPPALGRAFSVSRGGAVVPYSFYLGLIGLEAPDPSLASVDLLSAEGVVTDLRPETSRTFTAGIDWDARNGPHTWSFAGTYYNIKFEDRLGATPLPGNLNFLHAGHIAWNTPEAVPPGTVVFFPSPQLVADTVAAFQLPLGVFPGASLDNVGIIYFVNMIRNLAITETDGFDLRVDYAFDSGVGIFSAGLNANYINSFTEQAATTSPSVRTLNTLYRPVDLQVRAQLGYANEGFTTNLFVNHVGAYRTTSAANSVPIGSWTTVDATVAYEISESSDWLRGTRFSLTVSNLFDTDPPRTPQDGAFSIAGYDPANASPLGRFATIELRKAF